MSLAPTTDITVKISVGFDVSFETDMETPSEQHTIKVTIADTLGVENSNVLNFDYELITDWTPRGIEMYTFYVSFDVQASIDAIPGVESGDEWAVAIKAAILDDQFEADLETNLGVSFAEVDSDPFYIYWVSRNPSSVPSSLPTILPTSVPTNLPTPLPTSFPTTPKPSFAPTPTPSGLPTPQPSVSPYPTMSSLPTPVPTSIPTIYGSTVGIAFDMYLYSGESVSSEDIDIIEDALINVTDLVENDIVEISLTPVNSSSADNRLLTSVFYDEFTCSLVIRKDLTGSDFADPNTFVEAIVEEITDAIDDGSLIAACLVEKATIGSSTTVFENATFDSASVTQEVITRPPSPVPSPNPTQLPTPVPTTTPYPSPLPSSLPTFAPTPFPTAVPTGCYISYSFDDDMIPTGKNFDTNEIVPEGIPQECVSTVVDMLVEKFALRT